MAGTGTATRFKPGQSGNPSGRPKVDVHITELARAHSVDAIKTLATICKDPNETGPCRVAAAVALLDRGWGRPLQQTDVTSNGETTKFVIMGVLEAEDSDAWLRQYAPPKTLTAQ